MPVIFPRRSPTAAIASAIFAGWIVGVSVVFPGGRVNVALSSEGAFLIRPLPVGDLSGPLCVFEARWSAEDCKFFATTTATAEVESRPLVYGLVAT